MKNKTMLMAAIMTMLGANMSFAAVEIGDNSIAEGNQAIATGRNSIAVGTNAVATGDNLTGDEIKQKLAENEAKLAEIERLTKLVNDETIEFNQKYAIYNRVKAALEKIAANNELIQNTLQPALDSAKADYNTFKPEYDETVRQMNERLAYISKLNFSLLATDPNGLDTLATELKTKSEDGFPGVSNDLDFYKTYIQNYIKAKGDLENIKADRQGGRYDNGGMASNNQSGINTNGYTLNIGGIYNAIKTHLPKVYSYDSNFKHLWFDGTGTYIANVASIDDSTYSAYLNEANRIDFVENAIANLPLDGALSQAVKDNMLEAVSVQKKRVVALINMKHEQYLYDSLKGTDLTTALQHLQNKVKYEEEVNEADSKISLLYKSENSWKNAYDAWYKANVTDVENSNTLTVNKLSSQYRAAIADKQAKLDDLDRKVKAADAAIKDKERENAQLQPTPQELADAADAERVKQKLDADKAALDEAKRTLALNDLKNIGTNAISVGNNSLVTGKNAIGIGTDGLITGEDAIGIGRANTVTGTGSAAIGTNNSIRSNNALVFGNHVNIPTDMDGAIVFGNNSTPKAPTAVDGVTPDATVSFGSTGHERQLVNVAKGEVSASSTDAINGSQLFAIQNSMTTAIDIKANKDASNLDNSDVSKWLEKLGTGTNTQGSTGLVTGDTLYNAIKDFKPNNLDGEISKDNTDKGVTGDKIATALEEKANKDASNLDASDVTKWQDKLGNGTVTDGNTGLVTGDTVYEAVKDKANINLDNISTDGEDVIRNLAKGSVKVIAGQNTTVTEGTQGSAITYAVNVSNDAIKGAIQPELDKKANTDASNLSNSDVTKWQEKLGTGSISEGNTGLVTGGTVYEIVKNSAGNPLVVAYDSANKDHITLKGQDGTVISNVKNGAVVPGSKDAINGGQLYETNSRISQLGNDLKHVGATAAALAGLHPQDFDEDYKFSVAAARGSYDGASAYALGAFYRPNSDLMFNVAGTVGSGEKAYTMGVSYKFGTSTKQSVLADNAALRDEVNQLKSMMNTIMNSPLFKLSPNRASFPDVPSNRWDAKAVETLHANGVVEGYPDGTFKGEQPMTRSEYAQIVYSLAEQLTNPAK